ncbi:hypothetical protein [Ornithinimicrobium kibberense]|uniref:hypothetical protein n=1 Tax=Ornithinimicrobium kibberense TaxID=282060 RepID=UPI00360ABF1B
MRTTSWPRSDSHRASRSAWVDLPAPSPPSKATNSPRAVTAAAYVRRPTPHTRSSTPGGRGARAGQPRAALATTASRTYCASPGAMSS